MDFNVQELQKDAEQCIDLSTRLSSNSEPQRRVGVLTIGIGLRDLEIHSCRVGTVNDTQKWNRYERLSPEKLYRLQADWLRDPTIISSWWTRQPESERYGGAVLLPYEGEHCIISFSGLLEHVDESVSLMIGHKRGIANEKYVLSILEKSKNHVFEEMKNACGRKAA